MMRKMVGNIWTFVNSRPSHSLISFWLVTTSIMALNKHTMCANCSTIVGDLGHEIENSNAHHALRGFLADVQSEPVSIMPRRDLHNSIVLSSSSSGISPAPSMTDVEGACSAMELTRRSWLSKNPPTKFVADVLETALMCSNIDASNYEEMITSISGRRNMPIHQVHIVYSESDIFATLDLICGRYDCSRITVFNATGDALYESNKLIDRLTAWTHLEVLDLSNTSLNLTSLIPSEDHQQATPAFRSLTHLYLNGSTNRVRYLNFTSLLNRMPVLRHLSLTNNIIDNIYCNESLRYRIDSQLETINLAGSLINCDKNQLWFMKLIQSSKGSLKFPEQEHIKCLDPEHLTDMTWAQRVSVHETRICDSCICRSLKRSAISVDCHNKNLTALPDVLPLNTKILNLTSNLITSISVPKNSKNWENVTYVHLENNLISSFQQIKVNSKFMRNLAALDIRRNRFQEFPSHILEQFINLDQVHLSNNPWLCDCESAFAFQEWLQRQFHKVGDKEEIRCGIPGNDQNGLRSIDLKQRLSSRVIYKLSKSELCPQDNLEEPYDWLDIINLTLGITIILIITKVIMDYIYQRRTKRLPHFFRLNI